MIKASQAKWCCIPTGTTRLATKTAIESVA
jgi:hypothetical protein